MDGTSCTFENRSLLGRIDFTLYRFEKFLAFLSGLAVLLLIFFSVFSVGGRNFLNTPLPGYVDWIEQIMPFIAFLGISYTQRDGGHIRMDILIKMLHGRFLLAAEMITVSIMLVLMILMVWGSWAHFQRSFDWSQPMWSLDSSIDIALPIWPTKLLIPLAFSVLCVRFVLQLFAHVKAFITNK